MGMLVSAKDTTSKDQAHDHHHHKHRRRRQNL
ncbi:MAG: hypothetical protein ACI95S_002559, partial [Dinoroseobacter sp.]